MSNHSRPAIQKLQAAKNPTQADTLSLFPAGFVAQAEYHDVDQLTATIKNWNHMCDHQIAAQVEAETLEMRLVHTGTQLREAPLAARRLVAHRARQYMVLNMDEPLTIKDICQAVHTAERTLHLGFLEAFGITPKRFLKSLRLNAIRRDLQHALPHETVTHLACRWGFFHFSNFAADYRRLFGESPSETLRRCGQPPGQEALVAQQV